MNVREWALIIFTILGQMSVGAFLMLRVVHLYAAHKAGVAEADRLSDRALLAIIVTLGLGMVATFFHLSNPLGAPRALTNVASSWLSREIAFSVAFAVLGAAYAAMQWFKAGSAAVRNALAWVAALVGVGFVYSMARAYMLPTQPAWNNPATPVSFFATSLLLGSLALGVAFFANFVYNKRTQPDCVDCQTGLLKDSLGAIAVVAIAMLGVEFVTTPLYIGSLATQGGAALTSVELLTVTFNAAFVTRLVLGFLGAGVFGLFTFQVAKQGTQVSQLGLLASSAFVLVLAAEVIGRVLFYSTHVNVGLF